MNLKEKNRNNIILYKETKDEKYKEIIIAENRKLSLLIFNKYKEMYKINSPVSLNDLKYDLIQEGDLALSIAIDEYDVNKGIEFSTYAYKVIENAFYNYFIKNKNLIRIPKRIEMLISKVRDIINAYREKNNSYPSNKEIVEILNDGTPLSQIDTIIPLLSSKSNKVVNLSDLSKCYISDQDLYSNLFVSEYDSPLEAYKKKELHELVEKAIEELPIRHKSIVIDYLQNHYTFKEIAKKYCMTIEGARQLYLSAINKINIYINYNK